MRAAEISRPDRAEQNKFFLYQRREVFSDLISNLSFARKDDMVHLMMPKQNCNVLVDTIATVTFGCILTKMLGKSVAREEKTNIINVKY